MIEPNRKKGEITIMKNNLNTWRVMSKDTLPLTEAEHTAYALVDIKSKIYRVCTQEENTTAIEEWLAEMAKENRGKDDFTIVVVKAL